MGALSPLPSRSCSYAASKRCAARTRLVIDVMRPYLVLTTVRCRGLLVCAQKVDAAPILSSVRRSLRSAERVHPTGHLDAREPRRSHDPALPQAPPTWLTRRQRMNQCSCVSSDQMAGRRDAYFSGSGELLRDLFHAPC